MDGWIRFIKLFGKYKMNITTPKKRQQQEKKRRGKKRGGIGKEWMSADGCCTSVCVCVCVSFRYYSSSNLIEAHRQHFYNIIFVHTHLRHSLSENKVYRIKVQHMNKSV